MSDDVKFRRRVVLATGLLPAKTFHPCELPNDEIAARGWSQSEFAERCGFSNQYVSDLLRGKRGVSIQAALAFERVLGTSAEWWVTMQASYDLARARGVPDGSDYDRRWKRPAPPPSSREEAGE